MNNFEEHSLQRFKSGTKTTSSSKTLEILFPCLTFEKNIRSCTNLHVDGRIDINIHTFDGIILSYIRRQSRLKRSPFALVCRLIRPLDFFEWQLYFLAEKKIVAAVTRYFFIFTTLEIFQRQHRFFLQKNIISAKITIFKIFFLSFFWKLKIFPSLISFY